jgi:hypothetical protein
MRLKCQCGSTLFSLHYPPEKTKGSQRVLYLICSSCQALVGIKLRNIELDVNNDGVIQKVKKIYGQENPK